MSSSEEIGRRIVASTIPHNSLSPQAYAEIGASAFRQFAAGKMTPPAHDRPTPFYIVMNLDHDGPCENGDRPYHRHPNAGSAHTEARRLAKDHGCQFAVLKAISKIGYDETKYGQPEADIPF